MKVTKHTFIKRIPASGAVAVALLMTNLSSQAAPLTAAEATKLGTEAAIYGYPLITMEYTRRVITNVEKVEGSHAPTDKFIVMLRLYWPSDKTPSIIDGTWKIPAVKPAT